MIKRTMGELKTNMKSVGLDVNGMAQDKYGDDGNLKTKKKHDGASGMVDKMGANEEDDEEK